MPVVAVVDLAAPPLIRPWVELAAAETAAVAVVRGLRELLTPAAAAAVQEVTLPMAQRLREVELEEAES
jgi:hypothetical protein